MAATKDIILGICDTMSAAVCPMVPEALDEAAVAMRNFTATSPEGQELFDKKREVLERFKVLFGVNFDHLVMEKSGCVIPLDYSSLSLVQ